MPMVSLDLLEVGAAVEAVADLRENPEETARLRAVRGRGVRILAGHAVIEAIPGVGKLAIIGATVARILAEGETRGRPPPPFENLRSPLHVHWL